MSNIIKLHNVSIKISLVAKGDFDAIDRLPNVTHSNLTYIMYRFL